LKLGRAALTGCQNPRNRPQSGLKAGKGKEFSPYWISNNLREPSVHFNSGCKNSGRCKNGSKHRNQSIGKWHFRLFSLTAGKGSLLQSLNLNGVNTLKHCQKLKCEIKNLKTYSNGCPNQGLSNHTTFRRF